ncbi:MAG TPA: F0F1 ATP synthase subunit delta [Terriglobales bacterium]|nr:F0F1 ATP synthase subunit delta [Terriglobales bacterium]
MKKTAQARRQAKQLFRLCLVNGMLDEARVNQAVRRVLQARQRGYMDLLAEFRRLVKIDRTRHTADVESARPLPADLRTQVQASLERLYGPGITTSFAENPALIGGMRIRVASDVYDGSVRAGLVALEKRF